MNGKNVKIPTLAILALLFLFPCSQAGELEDEGLGYKSFEELGGLKPSNNFSCQADKETLSLTFTIPSDFEDWWYIIHLHFYIEIAIKENYTGEEYVLVDAEINGLGCVFAEFFPFNDNGTNKIKIKYFNMIQGRQEYVVKNNSATVYIANYLPKGGELPGDTAEPIIVEGLKPGENLLNISLTGGNVTDKLIIFENLSGIERTTLAPPDVEIGTPEISGQLAVGKAFTVTVRVRNNGTFPLKNVTMCICYPSDKLILIGNATKLIYELKNETKINWSFKAKNEGDCKLVIIATSSNNGRAVAKGFAEIRRASVPLLYFLAIIIAFLGILIYALVHRARKSE